MLGMDCSYCSVTRLRTPDSENVPPPVLPRSPRSITHPSLPPPCLRPALPLSDDTVTLAVNSLCWQSSFSISMLVCELYWRCIGINASCTPFQSLTLHCGRLTGIATFVQGNWSLTLALMRLEASRFFSKSCILIISSIVCSAGL